MIRQILKSIFFSILLLSNISIYAQYDNCATAGDLSVLTSPYSGSTAGLANDFAFCAMGSAADQIFYYDLPNGSTITINQTTNGYDSRHSLRYGGACPGTTQIVCTDDPDLSVETWQNCTGSTQRVYWIQSGWSSSQGTYTLQWSITGGTCPVPPANDLCANATSLPCGTTGLAGSTDLSSNITHGTGCTMGNYGVWYTFVGNGLSTTISSTAAFDHEMAIVSGSCGSFSNIACIDGPGAGGTETHTFNTVNGTTYYVYISHYLSSSSTTGTFTIDRTCPCSTVPGTSGASPNVICPSPGNTTLTLAGEDPAATIQWQVSTDGGTTWSNIVGATTDPWVQAVSTNSMYQALVTNGCTATSTSSSVTAGCTIIQPSGSGNDQSFVATCGTSYNYYDEGGSGGSYTNNETTMATICPSVAGQYVSVNFSAFNLENNDDFLYIFDGNDGSANLIGVYSGTSPGTITASSANASGCLSFRFMSDNGTTAAGWAATITCTGTPAAPYPTPGIEDCNGAVTICSNSTLSGGTGSFGNFQELPPAWNYCINPDEHQSNWYVFSPQTGGTIGFQITPASPTDYDWAIWGPYNGLQCPTFTNDPPIRCSSTQLLGNGNTGLVAPANDTIEQNGEYAGCCGSVDDGFLRPMDVLAGEIYVMMIDNWDNNSVNFDLDWNLTNGATLDCTPPLPVTLVKFEAKCDKNRSLLEWTTDSEINNDFFIVEKSGPDLNFKEIGKVFGSGNSQTINHYSFSDTEPNNETAYYRLIQVDYDGSVQYHRIVASNCHDYSFNVVKTNLTSNNLDLLITSGTNEHLTISLYNSTGKLITKEDKELNTGNNSISLNNFNLSKGIYLISIQGEYNNYSQKVLSK